MRQKTTSVTEDKYSPRPGFRQRDRLKQAWIENGIGENGKEWVTPPRDCGRCDLEDDPVHGVSDLDSSCSNRRWECVAGYSSPCPGTQSFHFRLFLHGTLYSSSWPASVLQDQRVDNLPTPDAAPTRKMFVPQVEFFSNHHTTTSIALHTGLTPFKRFSPDSSTGFSWIIRPQG